VARTFGKSLLVARGTHFEVQHQYLSWIGTWGSIDSARIVLTERADDGEQVLATRRRTHG
jgi:hypothetical protein